MPTMTTRLPDTLKLALDLGNTTWKLGSRAGGRAQPPCLRTMSARDLTVLKQEIASAKQRFHLPDDAQLRCENSQDKTHSTDGSEPSVAVTGTRSTAN